MGRKHNFTCYENGRKFTKRVENSLRAISPFPTVFLKDLYCRHAKTRVCLGKGYLFTTQSRLLTTLKKKPFENNVGKGENAAIFPSPTMFSTHPNKNFCF